MRTIRCLMGALASAFFVAGHATAASIPVFPEGTAITGDPASLLGYDAASNDYIAGGVSSMDDLNLEFLTDDFALGIDFGSDGLLSLWDNLGTGDDLFNYSLRFSLAGLGWLYVQGLDISGLTGGSLAYSVVGDGVIELALRDVQFAPGFSHADLAVSVDEPSMLPLLACGLVFGIAVARRRRSSPARFAAVVP